MEASFGLNLPDDYTYFMLNYGDIFSPRLLSIIVDKEIDLHNVQEFWDTERIIYDKENEWTSNLEMDLIPFASDCMGNIFAFSKEDLIEKKPTAPVYFFDHDFNTIEKISESFTAWIDSFNKI